MSTRWRIAAVCGAALGPAGAWGYQTGPVGRIDGGIWVVVLLAAAGVVVGALSARRGAWALGLLGLVVNAGVAALYGFPAIFVMLGGSR